MRDEIKIELTGAVGSESFSVRQVQDLPPGPVLVIVDSPGGCLVSGLAIFQALRDHSGKITTEIHRAGSAAAIPALAGDVRLIDGSGYFFVHGCWGSVVGRESDMREAAARFKEQNKLYDSIISERTGLSLRRVRALTRNETRISSSEAVRLGFAHSVIGKPQPCPPSPSIESVALAALQHEKRALEPPMRELCAEARPVAMLDPRAGPVLDRPGVQLPPIPDGRHGEALERWAENERREAGIRQRLARRLRQVIDRGGKLAWPVRVTWTCPACNAENFGPPAKNKLSTPCRECGATSPEGN